MDAEPLPIQGSAGSQREHSALTRLIASHWCTQAVWYLRPHLSILMWAFTSALSHTHSSIIAQCTLSCLELAGHRNGIGLACLSYVTHMWQHTGSGVTSSAGSKSHWQMQHLHNTTMCNTTNLPIPFLCPSGYLFTSVHNTAPACTIFARSPRLWLFWSF